jgi:hypothetical protein
MPDQIIFRGAYIRRFSESASANGEAVFVKISIGCDFTKPVRDAMKWGELPEGFSQASLEGELNAQTFSMDPGAELEKHKFDLPISVAQKFQVVSLVVPDKPNRLELRFQVKSAHHKATRIIDDYFRTLGQKKGQLRISYVEDEQGTLGLEAGKQEALPLKGEAAAEHAAHAAGKKGKVN